jgi:hypothetical protein
MNVYLSELLALSRINHSEKTIARFNYQPC